MDIKDCRKEFPILDKKIYLNSCSLGALSKRSRKYLNGFLDDWDNYGASAWYKKWLDAISDVRSMTAQILNAEPDEIAIGPSVSALLSSLSSCLDFGQRSEVVITDMDFPTSNYQWLSKKKIGVETKIINSADRIKIDIGEYERSISENCAVVSTSHVFFLSGCIQDVKSITQIARKAGALSVIDAYQSVGQVPVDVKELDLDILLCGGLKWLLGGPGITFMYCKRSLISDLEPTNVGWFGVRDQLDFNQTDFEYRNDAIRFESGTPSLSAVYQAKAGLELYLEIGPQNIQKATKEISEHLISLLQKSSIPLRIPDEPSERSAIIMAVHKDPGKVVAELAKKDIIVDYRKDCIRISPYFYNNEEDIEKFVPILKNFY